MNISSSVGLVVVEPQVQLVNHIGNQDYVHYKGKIYNKLLFQFLQINGILTRVSELTYDDWFYGPLSNIMGCFNWSATDEGRGYWRELHENAINYIWARSPVGWEVGQVYKNDDGNLFLYKSHGSVLAEDGEILSVCASGVFPDVPYSAITGIAEGECVWRFREASRMKDGTYLPIVTDDIVFDKAHYVHWSVKAGEKLGAIAFTPTDEFGDADRQLTMKLGKYIRKYHTELLDHEVRDLVGKLTSYGTELKICTSFDDIEAAFNDITCSCMGGDEWALHPSIVYSDTPDVAVAYIEDVGRTVINMMDRTWCVVYGDESRMIPVLALNGYIRGGGLAGCTMSYHEHNGMPVMPYLDGETYVTLLRDDDSNKYWVVGDITECPKGHTILDHVEATYVTGYTQEVEKCGCCDAASPDGECLWLDFEEEYRCQNCLDDVYPYNGGHYSLEGLEYNDLVLVDGEVYGQEDCIQDYRDEVWIVIEDAVAVWHAGETVYMSEWNANRHCEEIPSELQDDCEGCTYVY